MSAAPADASALMRDDLVQSLIRQRESAMNSAANLEVQIHALARDLAALVKRNQELEAALSRLGAPKAPPGDLTPIAQALGG